MSGSLTFQPNTTHNTNNQWPLVVAKNYDNMDSIFQTMPHLKLINTPIEINPELKVTGLVIRSANDDNVHKAIKYGIWTTTPRNRGKIEQLWQRKANSNIDTYLFFSAVKSGMFEGVARLKSGYHEQTFPFWWQNHTLKFKGYFEIQWIYIKDVSNKYFYNLYNIDGQQAIKSKDCDSLDSKTTQQMLAIFQKRPLKRSIFVDFPYMDERQTEYIRKMYQMTQYYNYQTSYNNNYFDLSQFSLAGHPLNLLNNSNTTPLVNPMMSIPSALLRPVGADNQAKLGLNFEMNGVSNTNK